MSMMAGVKAMSDDDLLEVRVDAVGEFIEWLEEVKAVRIDRNFQKLWSEYFGFDVRDFYLKREIVWNERWHHVRKVRSAVESAVDSENASPEGM